MTKRGEYLGRVQILRFFAASAVLFAHLQHEVLRRWPHPEGFRPFTWIDGGFGVDLFFVISGFIMYHVSADKFGRRGAAGEFLLRRYLRIAPLYYLATVMMLGVTFTLADAVSIARPGAGDVLASFLFLPMQNSLGEVVPVLKLGWTLNFEAYFYVVFAVGLMFGRRVGLLVMTVLLTGVVILAQTLPTPPIAITFWGQSLVYEFLGGVVAAILYRRGLRLKAPAAWAVIVGSLILVAGLRSAGLPPLLPRAVYSGIAAWLIVVAVVSAPFDESRGKLQRILAAGGEASYAIYVIHPFGLRAGTLIWDGLALPTLPWLYIAAMMVVVIASAFAVNVLVERPLDRAIRSLLDRTRSQPAHPARAGSGA